MFENIGNETVKMTLDGLNTLADDKMLKLNEVLTQLAGVIQTLVNTNIDRIDGATVEVKASFTLKLSR